MKFSTLMRGLDPRIQYRGPLDCRVKPGNEGLGSLG
jgi:hypothetical protein